MGEVAAAWASGALSLVQAIQVILERSAQQGRTRGAGAMTPHQRVAPTGPARRHPIESGARDLVSIAPRACPDRPDAGILWVPVLAERLMFCFEIMEATPGIEPGYTDLQSVASPLRHVAIPGAGSWLAIANPPDHLNLARQAPK